MHREVKGWGLSPFMLGPACHKREFPKTRGPNPQFIEKAKSTCSELL